jgi:hypothetical protein
VTFEEILSEFEHHVGLLGVYDKRRPGLNRDQALAQLDAAHEAAANARVVEELQWLNQQGQVITQRFGHKEIYSIPGSVVDRRIAQLTAKEETDG